jgi:protein-S-isoprenylcysteine O-methyltransferase Ste14
LSRPETAEANVRDTFDTTVAQPATGQAEVGRRFAMLIGVTACVAVPTLFWLALLEVTATLLQYPLSIEGRIIIAGAVAGLLLLVWAALTAGRDSDTSAEA